MNRFVLFTLILFPQVAYSSTSVCHGSTSNGRLDNGVELPSDGNNFVSYSTIARLAGRTYVHSSVNSIIINAFKNLEVIMPKTVYKYAETGYESGGVFSPHKTHQNGLSVDFMTPVKNEKGESVHLPTNPFNKFGYNIEFDGSGKFEEFIIDYEALAAHIVALDKESRKQGFGLWRVIFDPELQPHLFKTEHAKYLQKNIQFSTKRSWVRHDEHYHVDFDVPCK